MLELRCEVSTQLLEEVSHDSVHARTLSLPLFLSFCLLHDIAFSPISNMSSCRCVALNWCSATLRKIMVDDSTTQELWAWRTRSVGCQLSRAWMDIDPLLARERTEKCYKNII